MTRVIVMDREDHEPLTVVEVPAGFIRAMEQGGPRYWRKYTEPDLSPVVSYLDGPTVTYSIVTLRFEQVWRAGAWRGGAWHGDDERLFWYAYADNEETALLLRAAFLPGQIGEVQRREREAHLRGVFGTIGL